MFTAFRSISLLTLICLSLLFPTRVDAQSYQIDCAILLCLAGGWPSSAPCARARTEFIRRITPWPIEPPLQIWRCPLGASYTPQETRGLNENIFDAMFDKPTPAKRSNRFLLTPAFLIAAGNQSYSGIFIDLDQSHPKLVQQQADIDISGAEFNFIRSIRVFDVRYVRQRESDRSGDCNRSSAVFLGTYGSQGAFSWERASIAELPSAHIGIDGWGRHCPSIFHRSVFVDWSDFEGNYDFEQVNY